jgi:hypothetical protein
LRKREQGPLKQGINHNKSYHYQHGSIVHLLQDHQGYAVTPHAADATMPDQLVGEIPSMKLFESEKVLAFMDIQPLSKGHAVSIDLNRVMS